MFTNTIDKKKVITDQNGRSIVDFTTSIFKRRSRGVDTYNTVRMTEYFLMRPDKVAYNEYKDDAGTEYILKYSGISNPFSLKDDDILVIPDTTEADNQMEDYVVDPLESMQSQVRLYYKYTNTDFKSDKSSYDKLADKVIPSGVLDPTENGEFMVPYISDDGETAITIKNGRMYFGDYKPTNELTVDDDAQSKLQSLLDSKCLALGMSMTEFVKASTKNTLNDKVNNLSTLGNALTNSASAYNQETYLNILDNYVNSLGKNS